MNWKKATLLRDVPNSDSQLLEAFINYFGFDQCKRYEQPHNFYKLLAGERSYNAGFSYDTPQSSLNWMDHGELYRQSRTKQIVAIGHNYGAYEDISKHVKAVIEPLGVRAVIYERSVSWYYPNETAVVMFMTNETLQDWEQDITDFAPIVQII